MANKCCLHSANKRNHKISIYGYTDKAKTGISQSLARVATLLFQEWAEVQTKKGEIVFDSNNTAITQRTHLFVIPYNSNTKTITTLNGIFYRDLKYKIDNIENKDLERKFIYIYAHQVKDW